MPPTRGRARGSTAIMASRATDTENAPPDPPGTVDLGRSVHCLGPDVAARGRRSPSVGDQYHYYS